ncbi:hypothetical protein CANARDRAFT_199219 [[Candida] arabinofermentans NRRL YB-2248]|uniref:C2H2-type domain-containing protein n=1 Tax=[Candida] arabinofermentans NRRL YB-2248 TaxID=983967 RepID=A0A1E4T0F7_9ASCO|nr:hypothetical protein CANARDRAFT_199219 [[Candida] arabinofermentans NRRL YB-2248]
MSACDQETSNTEGSNNEETKHDHQAINNQVRQYFQTIQYNDEVSQNVVNVNAFGDVDLSSLHNEDFQIDASIATDNDKDDDSISAAAAAVAAYQHQLHTQQQEKLNTTGSAGTPFRLLEVLPGVDPKKMCLFCGKTFAHPGSLGRHLDNRKGSPLHPADKIDQLRANVARRGDPVAVKARRSLRARDYNRREHVKEKNRERRKYQSKIYRVKEAAELNFYKQLSMPSLPAHPSFPRMVLFFLPPSAWPHDPPTFQTYDTLCEWLKTNKNIQEKLPLLAIRTPRSYLEKLKIAFDNWLSLPNDGKKDMWIREQRICAQEALGQLTLFDYAVRETWTRKLTEDKRREVIAAAVATNGMSDGGINEADGADEEGAKNELEEAAYAAVAAAAAAVGVDQQHEERV